MFNYFTLAEQVAKTSHDPDTKLGCVVLNAAGAVAAVGSNRFADPADITPERLQRPLKHEWIRHAEHNAIDSSMESLQGGTLYCTAHPCSGCAERIVAAGIVVVSIPKATDPGLIARWKDSWAAAADIMVKGGVEIKYNEK